MATLTFLAFKNKLAPLIWPPSGNNAIRGDAISLRPAHDKFFEEALVDLQRWVDCLKAPNYLITPFCNTFFDCAKTVFYAPKGIVTRVCTLANDDWCSKVFYDSIEFDTLECWARDLTVTAPGNTDDPILPKGFRHPNKSTDSTCGRARVGGWAIKDGKFYLVPWIQSNETVVIEWSGSKTEWNDTDVMEEDASAPKLWDITIEQAVKAYVRWKDEADFGCDKAGAQLLKQTYADALADIIYDCQKRTERKALSQCDANRLPTADELAAEAVPDDESDCPDLYTIY